jgi:F-box interacting protein
LPSLECSYTPSYGFGHDHFTDNYKVVAVFRYNCDSSTVYKVKVHTLGTNSWRFIDDFPYGTSTVFPVRSSGEFVSGTLNWLVYLADSVTVRPIVSLDLGTESYQEILQPDYGEEGAEMVNFIDLGVLRDCLCILRGQDIWLMKEYGNRDSWTKFATVPQLGLYCKVIHISEDDQVLMLFRATLVVYDSINGTSKSLNIKATSFLSPKIYVESLISPCS